MPEIKALDLTELKTIYHRYMKIDFPPMELRPYLNMAALSREDCYISYGFYDHEKLIAYACLILQKDKAYAMLDYFAVMSELRGTGIGSKFLRQLLPLIPTEKGTFVETEKPYSAKSDADRSIRQKRIRFYQKNGALLTTSNCLLFGVDYNLLYFPKEETGQNEEELFAALQKFYAEIYKNGYGYICKLYR